MKYSQTGHTQLGESALETSQTLFVCVLCKMSSGSVSPCHLPVPVRSVVVVFGGGWRFEELTNLLLDWISTEVDSREAFPLQAVWGGDVGMKETTSQNQICDLRRLKKGWTLQIRHKVWLCVCVCVRELETTFKCNDVKLSCTVHNVHLIPATL